jgi:hypothetical protein
LNAEMSSMLVAARSNTSRNAAVRRGLPSCRGARHGRLQALTDDRQLVEHLQGLVVVDESREDIRIQHVPLTRRVTTVPRP